MRALPGSLPTIKPQPDRVQYGVSEIALFKNYMTREEYRAYTGENATFDVARRPKYWWDSSVDLSDLEEPISYQVVRMVKGVWQVVTITMPAYEAATVNIPETLNTAATPGMPEYQARIRPQWELPIRQLLPNERLDNFMNVCVVIRTDLELGAQSNGSFTAADRDLLRKIAAKLGV